MKLLAVDYGEKRIGLASGDTDGGFVFPVGVIENRGRNFAAAEINKKIAEENAELLVIGRPIGLSGNIGPQARQIDEFAAWLKDNVAVPIALEDERMTSKLADRLRTESDGTGASRDEVAAMIIAEGYMEKQKS